MVVTLLTRAHRETHGKLGHTCILVPRFRFKQGNKKVMNQVTTSTTRLIERVIEIIILRVFPYAQMCVSDALFGCKMEKGHKTARRTGPLRRTWFRMVVYY